MIRILIASAFTLASVAGLSAAASAETVKVDYTDLDLSHDAGLKALHARVATAITQVCGTIDGQDLRGAAQVETCRKTATADTIRQIAAVVDMNQRLASRRGANQIAAR
jgi:UrcA family protein